MLDASFRRIGLTFDLLSDREALPCSSGINKENEKIEETHANIA